MNSKQYGQGRDVNPTIYKNHLGHLGVSVGQAAAFCTCPDSKVLGLSPVWGSWLSGELASPSPSVSCSAYLCSLSWSNK